MLGVLSACCVFNRRSLATASNSRDFSSFKRARRYCPANIPQLKSCQLLTCNSLTRLPNQQRLLLVFDKFQRMLYKLSALGNSNIVKGKKEVKLSL
jgi:hypothetical protein